MKARHRVRLPLLSLIRRDLFPAVGTDSFKTGSAPVNAVVSFPRQADPIVGPSTHTNAVSGPSKQLQPIPSSTNNANSIVTGSSKQARSVSTSTSSSSTLSKQNSSSLSDESPCVISPLSSTQHHLLHLMDLLHLRLPATLFLTLTQLS